MSKKNAKKFGANQYSSKLKAKHLKNKNQQARKTVNGTQIQANTDGGMPGAAQFSQQHQPDTLQKQQSITTASKRDGSLHPAERRMQAKVGGQYTGQKSDQTKVSARQKMVITRLCIW